MDRYEKKERCQHSENESLFLRGVCLLRMTEFDFYLKPFFPSFELPSTIVLFFHQSNKKGLHDFVATRKRENL